MSVFFREFPSCRADTLRQFSHSSPRNPCLKHLCLHTTGVQVQPAHSFPSITVPCHSRLQSLGCVTSQLCWCSAVHFFNLSTPSCSRKLYLSCLLDLRVEPSTDNSALKHTKRTSELLPLEPTRAIEVSPIALSNTQDNTDLTRSCLSWLRNIYLLVVFSRFHHECCSYQHDDDRGIVSCSNSREVEITNFKLQRKEVRLLNTPPHIHFFT